MLVFQAFMYRQKGSPVITPAQECIPERQCFGEVPERQCFVLVVGWVRRALPASPICSYLS